MMTGISYGIWGFVGGAIIEGLEFTRAIRASGDWPWRNPKEPNAAQFAVSIVIRLAVGSGLAVGLGIGHQIVGVFGAMVVGIAAPLIVEQLAQRIPLKSAPPIPAMTAVADEQATSIDSHAVEHRYAKPRKRSRR